MLNFNTDAIKTRTACACGNRYPFVIQVLTYFPVHAACRISYKYIIMIIGVKFIVIKTTSNAYSAKKTHIYAEVFKFNCEVSLMRLKVNN